MAQKKWDIIVPLTAVALLSAILCSCAAPDNGQKLAKDFIAAGFRPMEPFQPRGGEKVSESGDLAKYSNGYFYLDKKGRILVMEADTLTLTPGLSSLSIKTYKGSDMLQLTKREIAELYGLTQEKNTLKGCNAFLCEYRIDDKASVLVIIGFRKPGNSANVAFISATYSESSLGKIPDPYTLTNLYDWPTMN